MGILLVVLAIVVLIALATTSGERPADMDQVNEQASV